MIRLAKIMPKCDSLIAKTNISQVAVIHRLTYNGHKEMSTGRCCYSFYVSCRLYFQHNVGKSFHFTEKSICTKRIITNTPNKLADKKSLKAQCKGLNDVKWAGGVEVLVLFKGVQSLHYHNG